MLQRNLLIASLGLSVVSLLVAGAAVIWIASQRNSPNQAGKEDANRELRERVQQLEEQQARSRELAKFAGTWELVSGVIDGQPIAEDEVKITRLVQNHDEFHYKVGDQVKAAGFNRPVAGQNPTAIDIAHTEGPGKGQMFRCIYEVDLNSFKVCSAAPGQARPTEFVSRPRTGSMLFVWKRAKQ